MACPSPDAFIRAFTADALELFTERLMALPGADPQVAYGLLRMCVSSAPVFLAQVTPPPLHTHDLFEWFDESMVECATALLVLPGHEELACGKARREQAHKRLQLPIRLKGGGVASITGSASCHRVNLLCGMLGEQGRAALRVHQRVHTVCGGHARTRAAGFGPASRLTASVEDLVCRADPLVLLRLQHFVEVLMEADEKVRRCKEADARGTGGTV